MNIKMLRTAKGSPNGYDVAVYEAGQTYEVGDDLAQAFIRAGDAEECAGVKAEEVTRNKADKPARNKAE